MPDVADIAEENRAFLTRMTRFVAIRTRVHQTSPRPGSPMSGQLLEETSRPSRQGPSGGPENDVVPPHPDFEQPLANPDWSPTD
jgi:hypothetical protein